MDRFPEAFRRFEEVVDVDRIKSFRQLTLAFSLWAGEKWKDTWKQREALRVEAERLGIVQPERPVPSKTWRFEWVEVKGKPQIRYRDLKTGRFIKKPLGES